MHKEPLLFPNLVLSERLRGTKPALQKGMKSLLENDILRFTRQIPIPENGLWEVALLSRVEEGEEISFRGRCYCVEGVTAGEFCGNLVYQARLSRTGTAPAISQTAA